MSFEAQCEREEQTLRESAADQLPDGVLLARAGDELFRVTQEARSARLPQGAPAGWTASSNGALVTAGMALRTGRAVALLVRSGYGFEAAGLVRRLGEITQHAAGCAQDPSGTYAENWGTGAGTAGTASKAYVKGVADLEPVREKWGFLSQMEHATAVPYLNFVCPLPEHGEIVHLVGPGHHEAVDGLMLSSAAWDLARTAAAVCLAHQLDDGPTLKLAEEIRHRQAACDARAVGSHQQEMSESRRVTRR